MAKFYETSIALCIGCCLLLLTACMLPSTEAASTSLRLKRSPDDIKSAKITSACPASTPCGWAVYTPFSRTVDYFMQNTCGCTGDDQCIRTEDDLSISAYVYRCRTTTQTQGASASSSS